MSRALWWVTNGRAVAPPATVCIIGVSTSRKSRVVRKERMKATIRARRRKISRTSSLTIRSTYRCRYRVSMSESPCHFSGRGRIAFASRRNLAASTVSSPVRVRKRGPSTQTMSPASTDFRKRSYASSPR